MPRRAPAAFLALVTVLASAAAHAAGIGVVLLHAGSSWPGQFENLGPRLEGAGFGQIAPQTCWSVNRLYGGTVEECQADIDKAIAALRDKGYDRIVLAGHDLGALVALYYADGHHDLAGVVVWGPRSGGRGGSDVDVENATRLVNAGAGDKRADFSNGYVYTTPRALLSFRGPDSPLADEEALLTKISAPLLWIDANDTVGPRDPTPRFNLAPATPLNTFIRSTTDHFAMVDKSADDLIAWLEKVKASASK
jgi:pimeloyl-ACP methyl ester carboxylesterase